MPRNNFAVDQWTGFREPCSDLEGLFNCVRYNEEGDMELAEEYLSQHPDAIDAQDDQGRTLVHMAAANGHMEALASLFHFNPTPDVQNMEGNTALHFAALNKCIPAASLLLDHGWKASAVNRFGQTPVQLISQQRGFEEMENFLLAYDESLDDAPTTIECYEDDDAREEIEEKSVNCGNQDGAPTLHREEGDLRNNTTNFGSPPSGCSASSEVGACRSSSWTGEKSATNRSNGLRDLKKGGYLGSANMEEIE